VDSASVLTLALLALALAVQPWSVLAGVVLVTTDGGVAKEIAYVVGWVLALAVVAIATVAFYPDVPKSSSSSQTLHWIEIVCGVLLGAWLLVRWRGPAPEVVRQPGWMTRLDTMPWAFALALGAFLPNYVIVVAAVSQMLQSGWHQSALALAAAGFIVIASAGVAAPLVVLVVRGDGASAVYQQWRASLIAHSRAILFAVGGLVALVLVAKGIAGLLTS
jgi:Sap, sulfolipid-1-addressing protein